MLLGQAGHRNQHQEVHTRGTSGVGGLSAQHKQSDLPWREFRLFMQLRKACIPQPVSFTGHCEPCRKKRHRWVCHFLMEACPGRQCHTEAHLRAPSEQWWNRTQPPHSNTNEKGEFYGIRYTQIKWEKKFKCLIPRKGMD